MTSICIHVPNTNCWFSAPRSSVESAMIALTSAHPEQRKMHMEDCWHTLQLLPYRRQLSEELQRELANATIYVFAAELLEAKGEEWLVPAAGEQVFHVSPERMQ